MQQVGFTPVTLLVQARCSLSCGHCVLRACPLWTPSLPAASVRGQVSPQGFWSADSDRQDRLCCVTLGKSWLLWPHFPSLQSPPQRTPGETPSCLPRGCPLAGGVWLGAPLPFSSSGFWAGGKSYLLSQQLLSPRPPAGQEGGALSSPPSPKVPSPKVPSGVGRGRIHPLPLKGDPEGWGDEAWGYR